jgi:hypothetical protein
LKKGGWRIIKVWKSKVEAKFARHADPGSNWRDARATPAALVVELVVERETH